MTFEDFVVALTPIRVEILQLLIEQGAMTMSIVAERTGLAPSTVTAHVACLVEVGLVRTWRDGRLVWVVSNCRGFELAVDWCDS